MIKAIVFDNRAVDEAFLQNARKKGVRTCVVSDHKSYEDLSDVYRSAAYGLGSSPVETVVVSSDPQVQKAARRAQFTVFGIGDKETEMDQILSGIDVLYQSMTEFPAFEDIPSFNDAVCSELTRYCFSSFIGEMVNNAAEVMQNAYAPYSNFRIGAAIYTDTGNVYRGCNVENASFGGTICAERGAAMASIAAEGKCRYRIIAITSEADEPAPPCAICRQFLSEFTPLDSQVFLYSTKSKVLRHYSFGVLTPCTFTEF